jgi:hypothetical protein
MAKYNIPIMWQSSKDYQVEAESLQDAVRIALKQFFSEPDENYLSDTAIVDSVVEEYGEGFDMNKALQDI